MPSGVILPQEASGITNSLLILYLLQVTGFLTWKRRWHHREILIGTPRFMQATETELAGAYLPYKSCRCGGFSLYC